MSDPRLNYHNEYSVELKAPDISAYKKTNNGIDYVISFDSGYSGPHVLISSVVHGNEPCGAIAIDWFLENTDWLENVTTGSYQHYYKMQYNR